MHPSMLQDASQKSTPGTNLPGSWWPIWTYCWLLWALCGVHVDLMSRPPWTFIIVEYVSWGMKSNNNFTSQPRQVSEVHASIEIVLWSVFSTAGRSHHCCPRSCLHDYEATHRPGHSSNASNGCSLGHLDGMVPTSFSSGLPAYSI